MDGSGFRLKLSIVLLAGVIVLGTLAFAAVEDLSLLDAFYFSIVTIATVGYGEIHPTGAVGKLLAIGLIIAGVGTFLEVIAGITGVVLKRREKELRAEKLHMISGLFFSEIGSELLRYFSQADPEQESLERELAVSAEWTEKEFAEGRRRLAEHAYQVDARQVDLESVRAFLLGKGDLLLRLLENPTILEHGPFTDLLRSVFHLRDELLNREDLSGLPESDKHHLGGDMQRAYRLLTHQWLAYADNLEKTYPYLYSLAVRTNPFRKDASPVVKEQG